MPWSLIHRLWEVWRPLLCPPSSPASAAPLSPTRETSLACAPSRALGSVGPALWEIMHYSLSAQRTDLMCPNPKRNSASELQPSPTTGLYFCALPLQSNFLTICTCSLYFLCIPSIHSGRTWEHLSPGTNNCFTKTGRKTTILSPTSVKCISGT